MNAIFMQLSSNNTSISPGHSLNNPNEKTVFGLNLKSIYLIKDDGWPRRVPAATRKCQHAVTMELISEDKLNAAY